MKEYFLILVSTALGVALLNTQAQHNFVESLLYGFGAAAGFTLVPVLFAGIRERTDVADVPSPFKGNAKRDLDLFYKKEALKNTRLKNTSIIAKSESLKADLSKAAQRPVQFDPIKSGPPRGRE